MTILDGLKQAASLHAKGDIIGARNAAETVLSVRPNDPVALQFAGVLSCESGDPQRGAMLLRRAVKHNPQDSVARLNLARALMELGKFEEAEECCAAVKSPSRELHRMRADILKAQNRLTEAVEAYERLLEAYPEDFESWNNLGNALHERGDMEAALQALDRARALRPGNAITYLNLGRVLISLERDEDSLPFLAEAARLAPDDPAPPLELGQALNRLDRPAEALPYLGKAARLGPDNPKTFVAIGTTFASLEERDKAEQAFRMAIKISPGFAAGYLNLGIMLEKSNRLDELENLLRQADAKGVAADHIAYLRAVSLRRAGRLEEALALARSTVPGDLDATVRAHFIGQVADGLNEVETAFRAFEEMNRAAARSSAGGSVDGAEYAREIQRLAEVTTSEFYAAWPSVRTSTTPPDPIFLMGFPRSGTTLLDTILMGHPDTHVLEEIPILAHVADALGETSRLAEAGEAEIAALRARYFDELAKVSPPAPDALVIDKNPLSILRIPLIHRLFPDAKIIFALRHPCDVVLSCFMQNFKVTQTTASFLDIRNAAITYDRVLGYWRKCQEIFPLQAHVVRYEAMVEDVEAEMRPLLDFLGLPWDDKILDHQRTAADRGYIRTPSYAQVTEQIYARASGRWERYRPYMKHVLPILEPWAELFEYGSLQEAGEAA